MKKLLSFLLRIFYIFPVKMNKVFLLCFDGTKIGYDSKAIADYAAENGLKYKLVWGVKDKSVAKKNKLPNVRFVKYKSLKGIKNMLTSRFIIYNVNLPSGVPFRKKQVKICTWHGYGVKKVGRFVEGVNPKNFSRATCVLSHSEDYTEKVLKDSFGYDGKILNIGVPRNDIFFSEKRFEVAQNVKEKYGVADKKIVLFAPTFRGDFTYEKSAIDYEKLIGALTVRFGGEWVLMVRLHPLLASKNKADAGTGIDVSDYGDMQPLLCAADVLVTDYSSSPWDFSLQDKPVFLFVPDAEKYDKDRGLYYSFDELPYVAARDNEELCESIEKFDNDSYVARLKNFRERVVSYEDGRSCENLFAYMDKVSK